MSRSVYPTPATPVVITGSDPDSSTSSITVQDSSLAFDPVGSHSSGATITTAQPLTAPSGATKLFIQALTQNVRFTLDGTAPTASSGFQLRAGDPPMIIPIGSHTVVKVIQESATASLQYQWGS